MMNPPIFPQASQTTPRRLLHLKTFIPRTTRYHVFRRISQEIFLQVGLLSYISNRNVHKAAEYIAEDPVFLLDGSPRASRPLESTPSRMFASPENVKALPSSGSRSTSVLPPYEGEQDISALLMLGAAEARNCKADLVEQVRAKFHSVCSLFR